MTPRANKTFHNHANVEADTLGCDACWKRSSRSAHKTHAGGYVAACPVCQRQKRVQETNVSMSKKERKRLKKLHEQAKAEQAVLDAIKKTPAPATPPPVTKTTLRFSEADARAAFLMISAVDDGEFLKEPVRVLVTWAAEMQAMAFERAGRNADGTAIEKPHCHQPTRCSLSYHHPPEPCKLFKWAAEQDAAREAKRTAETKPFDNKDWGGKDGLNQAPYPTGDYTWLGHTHRYPEFFNSGCRRCMERQQARINGLGEKLPIDAAPAAEAQTTHPHGCDCRACHWEEISDAQDRASDPDVQGFHPKLGPILFIKEPGAFVARHQRANRNVSEPAIIGKSVIHVEDLRHRTIYEYRSNSCGHMWVARGLPTDAMRCPQASCDSKKHTSFNCHYLVPTDSAWEEFREWEDEYFGVGGRDAIKGSGVMLPRNAEEALILAGEAAVSKYFDEQKAAAKAAAMMDGDPGPYSEEE